MTLLQFSNSFFQITLYVDDVKSYAVSGRHTNFSEIMQIFIDIGNGVREARQPGPDLTLGRRTLGKTVVLVLKNHKNKTERNDDHTKIRNSNNKLMKKVFMNMRKNYQGVSKVSQSLVKRQHDRKVNEIMEFLSEYYLTTNYLYDEVQRIKRQRKVKDDLRKMVEYLEKPDKQTMKAEVLQCFYDRRLKEDLTVDSLYRHKPNNLVINILKDPYNDY